MSLRDADRARETSYTENVECTYRSKYCNRKIFPVILCEYDAEQCTKNVGTKRAQIDLRVNRNVFLRTKHVRGSSLHSAIENCLELVDGLCGESRKKFNCE